MDNSKILEKKIEVESLIAQKDFFNIYILETLGNFSYRYFEDAQKPEMLGDKIARVIAIEKGIKEAIKIKNQAIRAGISELVKRVSKAEGPTIARELRINTVERSGTKGGTCNITARISFAHPNHDFASDKLYVEKASIFKFEDDLHFRNNLAKHLEVVCELFET